MFFNRTKKLENENAALKQRIGQLEGQVMGVHTAPHMTTLDRCQAWIDRWEKNLAEYEARPYSERRDELITRANERLAHYRDMLKVLEG